VRVVVYLSALAAWVYWETLGAWVGRRSCWHLVPSNGSTVRKLGAYYSLQLPSGFAAGFSCDPSNREAGSYVLN